MSLPTVMRIVDKLMEEDLVRLHGMGESTGGRPSSLLEFNGDAYAVVGVDLGGTKMFGTVADLSGTIQHERYIPHKHDNGPQQYFDELCDFILMLLDAPRPPGQRIRGIGVGAPGFTLVPEGIVTWAPSLGWRDLPLQQILTERFDMPVFVENDVNLTALGEWGFGAGRGAQNLVSIAIGTGIGAGIITGGALYRGHNQGAGEVGYLLPGVEFLGRCYDQFGALESLASGTGIAERACQLLEQENKPIPSEDLTAHDVFAAARGGEAWAQQVVSETIDYLSLAVASISALLDPEIIILGGGVAGSADLLIEPILQRLEGVVQFIPRLVASPLGRRAAAMGAIMLVLNATTEYSVVKRLP
jgi:glucokinase-like ROK family protein